MTKSHPASWKVRGIVPLPSGEELDQVARWGNRALLL